MKMFSSCLGLAQQELIFWEEKWLMSPLVLDHSILQAYKTTCAFKFENRWKIAEKNDNKVPFFFNNRKKDYVRKKPVWPPTEGRHMPIMTAWPNTLYDASLFAALGKHLLVDVMKSCFALLFLRQSTKDFSIPRLVQRRKLDDDCLHGNYEGFRITFPYVAYMQLVP